MKTDEALKIIGGSLSKPSKMPGWSIGLPDVQDLEHLNKIYKVCRATPDKRHWLPTREAWIKDHLTDKPKNLVIRFSAPMVNQTAPASWPNSSEVVTAGATCPAPKQNNECRDCRQCWDATIKTIKYGKH
jgi:hypothetical protein